MSDAQQQELSEVAPAEGVDLQSLRAACPSWHIAGSPGNWHAFRGGISMLDGPWSLLRCHLHADTLLDLAERLTLQAYLDGLNDQELAEVWQRVRLPESSGQDGS
jgi:hypothetical protein